MPLATIYQGSGYDQACCVSATSKTLGVCAVACPCSGIKMRRATRNMGRGGLLDVAHQPEPPRPQSESPPEQQQHYCLLRALHTPVGSSRVCRQIIMRASTVILRLQKRRLANDTADLRYAGISLCSCAPPCEDERVRAFACPVSVSVRGLL